MEYQCRFHGLVDGLPEGSRLRCRKCRAARTLRCRRRRKKEFVELLGGACQKCGYSKCLWALDFHHRDKNEKGFSIGKQLACKSKATVLEELKKCDLLCRNCHAEAEFEEEFA
jgi:hypothetical protein